MQQLKKSTEWQINKHGTMTREEIIEKGNDFIDTYHLWREGRWGSGNKLKDLIEFMAGLATDQKKVANTIKKINKAKKLL